MSLMLQFDYPQQVHKVETMLIEHYGIHLSAMLNPCVVLAGIAAAVSGSCHYTRSVDDENKPLVCVVICMFCF